MRRPDFFIVGAPKCGTTALYTYLKAHPKIFMPALKEPQFFAEDILGQKRNVCTCEDYLALFEAANDERRIGEASTAYLGSALAAKRIKAFNPVAQIIVMVRNPADMMYALHSHRRYEGEEEITDFETALEADEMNIKLRGDGPKRPSGLAYRQVASFSLQISTYFAEFGRDNVHVIVYEDFKGDTRQVYKHTLNFLGVPTDFEPQFPVINPNCRVRSGTIQRIVRRPPMFLRTVSHAMMPLPARRLIGNCIRRLNEPVEPRPTMPAELRRRLLRDFGREVEELGLLLNRDLSGWHQ
ncbi:MAG TPA: sulfotransferase domain-containing protein [Terriglobia bacterium]|nr:sulfotransferase domain-containing protein [Terriglobia bacterium]